jgi:hypothetical protein
MKKNRITQYYIFIFSICISVLSFIYILYTIFNLRLEVIVLILCIIYILYRLHYDIYLIYTKQTLIFVFQYQLISKNIQGIVTEFTFLERLQLLVNPLGKKSRLQKDLDYIQTLIDEQAFLLDNTYLLYLYVIEQKDYNLFAIEKFLKDRNLESKFFELNLKDKETFLEEVEKFEKQVRLQKNDYLFDKLKIYDLVNFYICKDGQRLFILKLLVGLYIQIIVLVNIILGKRENKGIWIK